MACIIFFYQYPSARFTLHLLFGHSRYFFLIFFALHMSTVFVSDNQNEIIISTIGTL